MNYFLAKTDPLTYSIDSFKAEQKTTWDGVSNPQALQAIRAMRPNDRVFVYHSGGQSAVVGLAKVLSLPRPDPNQPRSAVVDLQFLSLVDPPVTLAAIKASGLFSQWSLIRNSRLSTMPAPPEFVEWVRASHPRLKL
jgi:predicted RNA-binding protein with PUA-like domain